jgi:Rrf2 family nitric oxide-sensitive transcriptional repressor
MQLTLFSDYSLRLLLYLAVRRDRVVTLAEVSAAYGISKNHLVKVVQGLLAEGLIESVRGRGGGLRLAREPRDINVATVLQRTEPHTHLVECFDAQTNTCPIDGACGLKLALLKARKAFFSELEQYTLADFAPRAQALIEIWNLQLEKRPA